MIRMSDLSEKKKAILAQSLKNFDPRYDEKASLLLSREEGKNVHASRESVFYALALLLRQGPGDADRAADILDRVVSLQRLGAGQLWHGTFGSFLEQPCPVSSAVDIARLTPEARWQGDILWEKITDAFRAKLEAESSLASSADEICGLLVSSLREAWPEVWETYDPNWREFILSSFSLILEEYDSILPESTVRGMENAAREGLKGARLRAESGLTPMNTNVEVMHIYIFDAFGRRFRDPELLSYAAGYAAKFMADYREHHAVAEFNSPTYNGVVLTYTGLMRKRGSAALRDFAAELEEGLWADFADFYNPGLGDLGGPWSRAYGLGMKGTAFPMFFYLGLDSIPDSMEPPFGPETESACILCLSDIKIPESVIPLLTENRGERTVTRLFRELAERGDPLANRSLCTATAWFTDEMMLGAIRGSTNTSHQLHAAVGFWRNDRGSVSGFRIRRRTESGALRHQRTVFLNMSAEKERLWGEIRNDTDFPVLMCLELESPGAISGRYETNSFLVDGLRGEFADLALTDRDGSRRRAEITPRPQREGVLWLCTLVPAGGKLRIDLRFSLVR